MKVCNECGQDKRREDFHKKPSSVDGKKNICAACCSAKDKARYASKRQEMLDANARFNTIPSPIQ